MLRGGLDFLIPKDYPEFKDEFNRRNFSALKLLTIIGMPLSVVIYLSQLFIINKSKDLTLLSVSMFFYFAVLSILRVVFLKKENKYITFILYLVEVMPLVMTILMGTVFDPDHQALTFLLFLSLFPIFIYDVPWRLITFETSFAIAFAVLSFLVKEERIFRMDMLHLMEFYTLSLTVLIIILASRIEIVRIFNNTLKMLEKDELTGLYTRNAFLTQAKTILETVALSDRYPVVVYINFKGLKHLNNDYGLKKGDEIICFMANELKRLYPERNIARFTADKYALLIYRDELSYIKELVDNVEKWLYDLVESTSYNEASYETYTKGRVKIGFYEYKKGDNVNKCYDHAKVAGDSIIEDSDRYMAEYDINFEEEEKNRHYVLNNLDKAIESGWIKVYYQAVVRSLTGRICSEEALARWDDPERGMLYPDKFIPYIEKNRSTWKLDLEILRQVLKDFRKREEAGLRLVPVSINFSRFDFESRNLAEEIGDIVGTSGYSPDLIIIEITESVYSADPDFINKQIDSLHALGFRVWMDDFGSGYSSLNLLQDTNFDLIKLDMQFMRNFGNRTEFIMEDMIDMARKCGIGTLAEGIEKEEQFDLMRRLGCERLQGYYFSKPVSLETIFERYKNGMGIGFEDPVKDRFYDDLGKYNLNDPFSLDTGEGHIKIQKNLPCGILEFFNGDGSYKCIRANDEYIEFLKNIGYINDTVWYKTDNYMKLDFITRPSNDFVKGTMECITSKRWENLNTDEKGFAVTSYMHWLSKDPVTGNNLLIVVVLMS